MSEAIVALGHATGHHPLDLPDQAEHGSHLSSTAVPLESDRAETAAARVAQLYRELFPAVFGFIRFRVGNLQVAEDLTALVFERALSKLATVREADHVRGWLFAIARNAVADERRRRRPSADLEVAEALEHLWIESPEYQAIRRDDWRRLVTYLADLDDCERELLGLRFVAGLANREAGEIVGLNEANVAQIVHRAVVKLRRRFTDQETP